MADPERFYVDPDPDPHQLEKWDLDPNPNPFTRVRNLFLQIFIYCFQSLQKLVNLIENVNGEQHTMKLTNTAKQQ